MLIFDILRLFGCMNELTDSKCTDWANLKFCRPFTFNTLNAELNPICHLLALLGAHHILHISRMEVTGSYVVIYRSNDYK
jgi:hypothetical protein